MLIIQLNKLMNFVAIERGKREKIPSGGNAGEWERERVVWRWRIYKDRRGERNEKIEVVERESSLLGFVLLSSRSFLSSIALQREKERVGEMQATPFKGLLPPFHRIFYQRFSLSPFPGKMIEYVAARCTGVHSPCSEGSYWAGSPKTLRAPSVIVPLG